MSTEERASLMLDEVIADSELRFGKCGPEDVERHVKRVVGQMADEGTPVRVEWDHEGNPTFYPEE